MVEQVETKSAFINKKYNNEDRLKKDEEELEQLMAEQKGEAVEAEPEPENAEEKSFKKRYGDLRRHQQEKEKELAAKIDALQSQLSEATKKEINLPKSDEDIEAWASKYPDVAAIVETIAIKKAKEQAAVLEERVKAVDELQMNASREKAEAELLRYHPDFEDIRETDDFHNWVNEQPQSIQDALYENVDDAKSVSRVIDLYKSDMGITKSKTNASDKGAASSVKSKRSAAPESDDSSTYLRESQIAKMSIKEYEKRQEEIMDAQRKGKFIYDLSKK